MFTWKFTSDGPEGFCLSSDTKPTVMETPTGKEENIPNGTFALEMDSKKFFAFDLDNKQWRPQ